MPSRILSRIGKGVSRGVRTSYGFRTMRSVFVLIERRGEAS